MEKNRNVITKQVNLNVKLKDVFRGYLDFIRPIHKMRNQEIQVLSLLMYYNHLYLPDFKHEGDRWRKVFSKETKDSIVKELDMNPNVMQNTLSSLRKRGAITKKEGYNEINRSYMPGIKADTEKFTLSISFKVK